MTTRWQYVPEDAGDGCWMSAPWKPVSPWAEGQDWWKCGFCGQSMHRGEDDPWQCKFCGRIRDDDSR